MIVLGVQPPRLHQEASDSWGLAHRIKQDGWLVPFTARRSACFAISFALSARDLQGVNRFAAFTATVYIKAWFLSRCAIAASAADLAILQQSLRYPGQEIARSTSEKFSAHLWYLNEEMVGLAVFDSNVSVEEKRRMQSATQHAGQDNPPKRLNISLTSMLSSSRFFSGQYLTLLLPPHLSY